MYIGEDLNTVEKVVEYQPQFVNNRNVPNTTVYNHGEDIDNGEREKPNDYRELAFIACCLNLIIGIMALGLAREAPYNKTFLHILVPLLHLI